MTNQNSIDKPPEAKPLTRNQNVSAEIAHAIGTAWPNGYSHRDHFPQAVAIIQNILHGFYLDLDRSTEDTAEFFAELYRLAPTLKDEGLENFDGYFIHWHEIVKACAQAWPDKNVVYSQSPLELIVQIIDERDEALAKAKQADWQPIEAAPKDGKPFVAANQFDAFRAFYEPEARDWIAEDSGDTFSELKYPPTHWALLPGAATALAVPPQTDEVAHV